MKFRAVTGEGTEYLAKGSAADIWKVNYGLSKDGTQIPGSVVRNKSVSWNFIGITDDPKDFSWESFVKKYKAEVAVWCQLSHPNIIQVYGLGQDLNLRVDYCSNGCIRDICEVLEGLLYLHSHVPRIVHGSLNPGKIFINSSGQVKIGEFGLSALCYRIALWAPSISFAGSSRWTSPELFDVEPDSDYEPTLEADLWALACTIFEIISGRIPYDDCAHEILIQQAIMGGKPPGSFDKFDEDFYGYEFCEAMRACWSGDPTKRPPINEILSEFSDFGVGSESVLISDIYSGLGKTTSYAGGETIFTQLTSDIWNAPDEVFPASSAPIYQYRTTEGSELEFEHPTIELDLDSGGGYSNLIVELKPPSSLSTQDEVREFVRAFRSTVPRGTRQVSCTLCSDRLGRGGRKYFNIKPSNLERHLFAHYSIKPFYCIGCPQRFTTKDQLKRHVRKHHLPVAPLQPHQA